jgi:hypothetical protein
MTSSSPAARADSRSGPCLLRGARAGVLLLAAGLAASCGGGAGSAPLPTPGPSPACLSLPAITWQRGGAGASADWNDIAIDGHNRLWLAGWDGGTIGDRLDVAGNSRPVLRHLDTDGTLLRDSLDGFDTPGTDSIEAVAVTPQGELVIAGRTTGSVDGRSNAGEFDAFVAWGDGGGPGAAWVRLQTGTERPEHPRRLKVAGNGDVHVAGWDDDYIPTNYVQAWSDPIAFKFVRQGGTPALAWRHQAGSDEPDTSDALAVDAAGNTYLGGVVMTGLRKGMFVRKIAPDGSVPWTARYSAVGLDNVAALHVAPDGTLLMAGSVWGAFHGGTAYGGQDVFLARIAADDGRVLASWQYGSGDADWLTDMKLDADGHVLLLGETLGSLVPGQPNAGGSDLFMLRIAPDGRPLGATQWGTADDDNARRLAVDSCGRAAAVASSTAIVAGGRQTRAGLLWFWQP